MDNKIIFYVCLCILLGAGISLTTPFSEATVLEISYPAPNDIISNSARVRLQVVSTFNSSNCYFNYDEVYNQTVECNGTTLVNLPNADETYRIRVGDVEGSYVDQQLTVQKPSPNVTNFVMALTIIILCSLLAMIIYSIARFVKLETNIKDLIVSLCLALGFILVYQLNLEYINTPFVFDYLDLFMSNGLWILVVFMLVNYFVCATSRSFKKKGKLRINEM